MTIHSNNIFAIGHASAGLLRFICRKTFHGYTDSYLEVTSGRSGGVLVSINEVNLRLARLINTGMSDHVRVQFPCTGSISVCNQTPRSTQPGHPFVGRRSEYQP